MNDILLPLNTILLALASMALLLLYLKRNSGSSQVEGQERAIEKLERGIRDEISKNRLESQQVAKMAREEIQSALHKMSESSASRLGELSAAQETRLESVRRTVEERLRLLQEENLKQLEEMRATVDEKLQSTLERRISDSFKQVTERLEVVHQGLGDMKNLAVGVGDLKKVLANVKTRGNWGEIQLSLLLEQVLSPDQYEKNVQTRSSGNERVEFAVKIPAKEGHMWLPIDSKFPQEVHEKLTAAQEGADPELVEKAGKELEAFIKKSGREISEKYLEPPTTTDYAILFLPTEGLYAEVIRRPGLASHLQNEFRIAIAGPTTLAALLSTFQMGFRTMAIQQRTDEVWRVLGQIKKDFGMFGKLLDKTQKKLEEASKTIDEARNKSNKIGRRLTRAGQTTREAELIEDAQDALEDSEPSLEVDGLLFSAEIATRRDTRPARNQPSPIA